MRNVEVVRAWTRGQAAKTAHLWTDGDVLYSYRLRIGYRDNQGETVVILYRGDHKVSQTTSCHVGLALRYADNSHNP